MDLDSLYEDLALWEHDIAFPEGPWSLRLIGNQDDGRLLAGESIWANEDFPLKEALNDPLGPSLDVDHKSSRDDDPFANWLDDRVDLSEFDELINSPEFDTVMYNLDKSPIEILEEMEMSNNSDHQKKPSSISPLLSEEINTLGIANDSSDEVGNPKFNALNYKTAMLVTIEPRDIEYSSSSLASPSNGDSCNAEQPSTPPSPKSQEDAIIEQPDIEILMEVPVDPEEIMNSSSSESTNASPSINQQNTRSSRSRASQQKSRPKPYSRVSRTQSSPSWDDDSLSSSSCDDQSSAPIGNRKERKRDQNRNAASRYRTKKRAELSALDKEEAALSARNKELSQKANQLSSEIGYLKDLMRDMLISKGLIKK